MESKRANQSGSDDELPWLHQNVWERSESSNQLEPANIPTPSTTPAIRKTTAPLHQGIFQPPPSSLTTQKNAANLPSSDFEAAVSDPDSDFELVDSDTPSHLDGAAERGNRSYRYIPTALKEQYQAPKTPSISQEWRATMTTSNLNGDRQDQMQMRKTWPDPESTEL
jgi:hypothetical protein